jgi:ribosomal protein RSM22 (predicted rRNA methylase)
LTLPACLTRAIADLIAPHTPSQLAAASSQLTERYRSGVASQRAVPDAVTIASYLAARLPATYAATQEALLRLLEGMPDFAPRSLLDVGAGPGTASFAAADIFDKLDDVRMLDSHAGFRAAAQKLCDASDIPALQRAKIIAGDLVSGTTAFARLGRPDLVIAAYTLVELAEAKVAKTALKLLAAAEQVLVLIEPGTPEGWRRMMLARYAVISAGAHILAPCPHANSCPLMGQDWCHFSVRVQRSRAHKATKGADAPFEDEKFIYLVVTRNAIEQLRSGRIIAPPHISKPGIRLKVCTENSVETPFIPARDKAATRRMRHMGWGDIMPDMQEHNVAMPQTPPDES